LHRPSRASPFSRLNSTNRLGVLITDTPPASARSHSPCRSAALATCSATSDDEHAVSIVSDGPCNPSMYDSRPEITLLAFPVPWYPSSASSAARCPSP
jgi:hypothetical protein